jgi:hypothetical protein
MTARISLLAVALTLALAAALPAAAGARAASHLWATVNVCDTGRSPDTIGIRARMPGNGTRERMWMRFRTQFYSRDDATWKYVSQGGASRWVEVGSALFAFKETGYEFRFAAPAAGDYYMLRGVVEFQWRQGSKVRSRKRKFTESGHRTVGADPKDFSAARCRIDGAATPVPR